MGRTFGLTGAKLLLAVAVAASACAAQAADPEMAQCAQLRKASARLSCFESLSERRNAQPGAGPATTAGADAPPPAAAPVKNRRAEFGFSQEQREAKKPVQDRQLDRLTATVAAIRPFGAGYWSILTEDGAMWRITEARQSFRPPHPGDTIELRRAALGSYLLLYNGQGGILAKRLS